jgi:hypothetical protein
MLSKYDDVAEVAMSKLQTFKVALDSENKTLEKTKIKLGNQTTLDIRKEFASDYLDDSNQV